MTNWCNPAAPDVHDGRLAVGTEGFAGMNAGRESLLDRSGGERWPAHPRNAR